MHEVSRHAQLVAALVADLRPVRRVGSAWPRLLGWLAIVLAFACVLAFFADLPAIARRLTIEPDMWLAVGGACLTMVLAACAAFQLGLPDRSPLWSVLPLPGVALWIGASGMGCARTWLTPGAQEVSLTESGSCLLTIVGLAVPLSLLTFMMLGRGYSLYPSLSGAVAGLAVAAAAATLLTLIHPFDAAMTDLAIHAFAVLLVVLANRFVGGVILLRGHVGHLA